MSGRGLVLLGVGLIGLLAFARQAHASERVTIAVGGYANMAYLSYDVANALGAFEGEGLRVEFQYVRGGSQAAAAVIAGSADFSGNSFDHVVKAALQGKSLKMIAALSEVPGMRLLVRSSYRAAVRDLRDLKGRPIGVTGLGSATHVVLQYLLTRSGLSRDEVNAVPVGFEAMAAALEHGKVQGIITGGPPAARLLQTGRAFLLVDLTHRRTVEAVFGGPYLDTGLLTRAEVVTERPDLCRGLVRAVVRANRWIASHTPAEIAALLPDAIVQDRQAYLAALEVAHGGFSKDGRIDPRAVRTVIEAHRSLGAAPPERRLDAASLYDNAFVEQALAGR